MNLFKKKKYNSLSDLQLMEIYKAEGDLEVLGHLFGRHTSLVYGVCLKYLKNREDSRDAVMQIFEHLIGTLLKHEVMNFKSWLHVTTRNHCLMSLRKKNPENLSTEYNEQVMEIPDSVHHENETDLENDLEALSKCIEELKVEQQKCVTLFYLEKKSYQEIEEITRFSIKNVKSYIQNGKRNLKICIEKGG